MPEEITIGDGASITWRGQELNEAARAEAYKRMLQCVTIGEVYAQKLVSAPTRSQGPSQPYDPPHADTGKFRQSIFSRVDEEDDGYVGTIGSPLYYAIILEYGHPGGAVIVPKNASVLHWVDRDGNDVFVKRVIQGEMKPRPWLRPTAAACAPRWRQIWERPMPDSVFNGKLPSVQ